MTPDTTVAALAEDREAVNQLCKATVEAAYRHGRINEAAAGLHPDDLQAALRSLLAPAVPDEPTDLAVRVVDREGQEWARVTNGWVTAQRQPRTWEEVVEDFGPLTIVTPDQPEPADRPLRVGDRVRVAEDAPLVARWTRGHVGTVVELPRSDSALVAVHLDSGIMQRESPEFLIRLTGDDQ